MAMTTLPEPFQNSGSNMGIGQNLFGNGFNPNSFTSGLGGILSGIFNDSGKPYKEAEDVYRDFLNQAKGYLDPYSQAGQAAINPFRQSIDKMANPQEFFNNIMSGYQASPYARFQMQQGQNAANNAASASGLIGSTPFMQASQDYARNITSQDQNQYLQNILGINSNYQNGLSQLMGNGLGAGNSIANMLGQFGNNIAQARYNQAQGSNQDFSNMIGGALQLGSMFL